MTDAPDVHDALASHTNTYEVRQELHAVPPHAVYEVEFDGQRAVCKVARGPRADPETEAHLLRYVERKTSMSVPKILAVGSDHFVAEWHDGFSTDPTLDAERARTMGAGLATLHDETAGKFEATGFPHAEDGQLAIDARDSWGETVVDLLADRCDYLSDFGYDEVAETVRSFVADRPDLFGDTGDPVLAHGNYLPDHVAVTEDGVTCVIDWEHALVAPAAYDYWRTAMPLFGGPNGAGEAAREAFHEGYESVRPLPTGFDQRADCYQLVNMVSYLKALHLQRQQTGRQQAETAASFREHVFDLVETLREEDG